ncbi:hypothetical protein DHEL01_v212447 [Diaporthe helianthi]|uniref:Rhodopsin domain-containing protein n=1 Tax=Diaporthe helianthi TaxID=158607 RepID=A0A2P5HFX8_DIAHE|nr:hypothetical protein DHEL01_v212447 [Diaporthe helianthi]
MNATFASSLPPLLPQTQPVPTTVVLELSAEYRYIEPKIDVLSFVMTILSGTVVGLRIYNKFRRRMRLWWDDYIIVVAWILFLAFAIVTVFEGRDGLGRHVPDLSPQTIRDFALLATIASTINIIVTAVARIGFAVSLLRIAEGWPRRFTCAAIASWVKTSVMHILVGDDVTFEIVTLIVWAIIEPTVIIIAGSLPELRSFVWRDSSTASTPRLIPFTRRRNGIRFDSDFEFVRQQYLDAGGKTIYDLSTESKKSLI